MTGAESKALGEYSRQSNRRVYDAALKACDAERIPAVGWCGPDWQKAEAMERELAAEHALFRGDGELTALGVEDLRKGAEGDAGQVAARTRNLTMSNATNETESTTSTEAQVEERSPSMLVLDFLEEELRQRGFQFTRVDSRLKFAVGYSNFSLAASSHFLYRNVNVNLSFDRVWGCRDAPAGYTYLNKTVEEIRKLLPGIVKGVQKRVDALNRQDQEAKEQAEALARQKVCDVERKERMARVARLTSLEVPSWDSGFEARRKSGKAGLNVEAMNEGFRLELGGVTEEQLMAILAITGDLKA